MMRLASARILVSALALACHERADERVVYATLPLQPPVEKGQVVYLRGLPIGAVRAAAPAADSLRVTVAITRADAPLRRGDALRLKLAPVGGLVGVPVAGLIASEALEVVPGSADAAPVRDGDTLRGLPALRLDSAASVVMQAAPRVYRDAKRLRDALKAKEP